ncbi:MAG: TRAP transporter substrate-binding protein DctP [Myxococcota bacterium]|jgi:TRAP-type transport system periplasmic protein|nr:TRAP transporter substrate-binding protein DctP [Myxococcota bacterium]
MRRKLVSFRAVIALVGLSLGMAGAEASARTLKIATILPDGSSWLAEMRKAGDEIKERTQGRVKLKFYPGGVMGGDKTVMRKVRAGQLQGGAFTSGALAAVYPDAELYSLPLLFRDYEEVDFVRSQLDQKIMKGLAQNGFEALAITDGGFAYVLSQKPIRRVEDMEGTRVWLVEGDTMTDVALRIAGVAPVPLPIADVYTALQTGLVDTVAAPPIGAIAFQWHTRVKYLTEVPIMYLVGIFAVDQRAFSKISAKDQKVVREVVSAAASRLDEVNRADESNAREALKSQGIEFVSASSREEVQRWRSISAQAITQLRGTGRYSEETINQILTLLQEHRSGAAVPE